MKHYLVVLSTETKEKTEDGFLTLKEVSRFLQGLGFRWCKALNKWEQTFMHSDPYEEDTWTGAAVITERWGI